MAETNIPKPKVPGAGGSFKIAGKRVPKWALFAGAGGILAVLLFKGKSKGDDQGQGEFNQEGEDAAGGLLGLFEELIDMYPDPAFEPEQGNPAVDPIPSKSQPAYEPSGYFQQEPEAVVTQVWGGLDIVRDISQGYAGPANYSPFGAGSQAELSEVQAAFSDVDLSSQPTYSVLSPAVKQKLANTILNAKYKRTPELTSYKTSKTLAPKTPVLRAGGVSAI